MYLAYPLNQNRESNLYQTIFEYINRLGSLEKGNAEDEKDKENAEAHFQKKLRALSKCPSFKEGNKDDEYSTVLHKAITVFKLGKTEKDEANESEQERINEPVQELPHELARDCSSSCAQVCAQKRVLDHIIHTHPELLDCNRDNSDKFRGQTPLHMAISKQNKELVKQLLDAARKHWQKRYKSEDEAVQKILKQTATGLKFKNNVMMGQLPLSIAALTGDKDIVKYLLEQEETDIYQQNSDGDNLCHSLLKYANIIPDREDDALEMMRLIKKEKKDCCKRLLSAPNKNNETPLILAAKYGQVELFKFIIEEGYCTTDDSSGLFDVKLYDMTDIDHQLKGYRRQQEENAIADQLKDSAIKAPPTENETGAPSVLDLIFHHSYKTSLSFVRIRPIQWMIIKKWRHYRKFLYIGLIFHIIIMSVLTAAAVERVKSQGTVTLNQGLGAPFPAYFSIIMIILSPLYIWLGCFKIVQICRGKFQMTFAPFLNPYANAIFHALFFLFALCIISDFGATWSTDYNNTCLIIAVVIGWYLFLFFLRATSFFCFFTSLIQRVLLQDLTRFAPIIALQLAAFSTTMFMLLYNPTNETNNSYNSWVGMLMLTFKSFLGLADIEIGDSSQPVLLSIVFIVFVIMTTILMLNALIAIMSSTCTDLLQNFTPDMHLYLQQLAIILFFEGLLPDKFTHKCAIKVTKEVKVDAYDRRRKKMIKMMRHLLRIDVIEEEDGIGGSSEANILHELHQFVKDTKNGNKKSPQTSLTDQFNGTRSLQRSMKSTKSTMSNTVEHLDGRKTLDIYHHPHPGQQ
ncbi:hypothetical protein ACJMK2_021425 [Sinanodonta woodiana]|uniref:Ion transport domain-containing protein n=1 Tax=Sinanodonta woodiana TaxID=1069815 RepID=A0ABD3TIF8_SINWO